MGQCARYQLHHGFKQCDNAEQQLKLEHASDHDVCPQYLGFRNSGDRDFGHQFGLERDIEFDHNIHLYRQWVDRDFINFG